MQSNTDAGAKTAKTENKKGLTAPVKNVKSSKTTDHKALASIANIFKDIE